MKRLKPWLGLVLPLTVAAAAMRSKRTPAQMFPNEIRRLLVSLLNMRASRAEPFDYIILDVPSSLPTFPESRAWVRRLMGNPSLSLLELRHTFDRIADDPRAKGVVLSFSGLEMGQADLQSLRDTILKLRSKGKRVVAYAHTYDTKTYYVASACDDIIVQEGGTLLTLGLRNEITFLRDALDAIGIKVDSVAISPYKSAMDRFTQPDLTPEVRDQMNWLLDSMFNNLVEGIAEGRHMTPEDARAMIDNAPYTDRAAHEKGYVDAVLTQEGLLRYLDTKSLLPYNDALKSLRFKFTPVPEKYIAVLPVSGLIVEGESRNPPADLPLPMVGGERMGHLTVVQQVRNLMNDEDVAGVVLWIDSGGGSASASEAMSSALDELARQRPLVVYMNNVAASGGYYIATPAQWIVAQASTITGSIGVINAKLVNSEMLKKLRLNAVEFTRGQNADLLSSANSFTEEQRAQMRAFIERIYEQFINRVARSRMMSVEEVDAIGGGRVWTGAQALEHGLVDELGGLDKALAKARELAGLPADSPAVLYRGKGKPLGPQVAEALNPAASLTYLRGNLELVFDGRAQMLMPFVFKE